MRALSRRRTAAAGAVATVAIAAVGALHLPGARRLLGAIGLPCPVLQTDPAAVEAAHASGLAALRGQAPAPARPALGLQLDRSTEAEAGAWARARHLDCVTLVRGYRYLRCRGVDSKALGETGPPVSELWLSFGAQGKLIGVNVYRRGLDAAGERQAWDDATGRLRERLGAPPIEAGDPAPAALQVAALRTARVQYRYSDYAATVTAAWLPYAGLAVREQYLSARAD
ncbi:MAG: hypothetical protein KGJ30_16505 [Burkholderiales bacterium]|nr:hypothetical protein [Burkholderiales bacterium]